MLTAMLEGLVRVNEILLASRPLPPIYFAGVRYASETGTEAWLTCEQTFALGFGDCEDLACWRAAELRLRGDAAQVIVTAGGRNLYHVRVLRENGDIEDPSRILGMGINVNG